MHNQVKMDFTKIRFSRLKFFYFILIIIFFLTLIKPTESHIFNIALRDEEDNFTTGKWILEGKKIYQDFFLQHQPLPTLMSAIVQKTTNPNSIFLLVKRHREFIFLYSFLFGALLTLRFGYLGLLITIAAELLKTALLG